jgi:very-short-patch-repair endonuclease
LHRQRKNMQRKTRGKTTINTLFTARKLREQSTRAEEILWDALRDRKLANLKIRRQHPIGPYVLDFFCVKYQLAIEVDGDAHLDPSQQEHDEIRTAYLDAHNIRVMRFKNLEIENQLAVVLRKIIQETCSPSRDAGLASGEGAGG